MEFKTEIKREGKNAKQMYSELFDLHIDVDMVIWYIEHYLYPEWGNYDQKENLNQRLSDMEIYHSDNVADFIKAMDYKEFLASPYWKDISEYKKIMAGNKCQLCNKKGELHTHHRTYSIHGYEIKKLDDLIVLCKKCHSKFHDKGGNK